MTSDRAAAFAEIATMEVQDAAFRREWLERGGHAQHFKGDPEKQAQWKRELPIRYVVQKQMERTIQ